jgi:hypothetical protein
MYLPYLFKRGKHPSLGVVRGGNGDTTNHVLDSRKATKSLIKIEILFCRGRYYIGGGEEPLIATVEGNTDPRRQRHLLETGREKVGGQNERRMEREWVGVKVVSANQAGTQHNK